MARLIEIGVGADGPVMLDVDIMLRSGLLVQANSGGGKSWVLRLLAEKLCAHVPVFMVDVEGEFASLREKFPFFLVAKHGGDTAADPRSAALVTRKLLELRVSAVFDLFELDIPQRHAWMSGFLGAMDQAPRDLWGDVAVLIDEAHVFAPERGKGESTALSGMSALATRGRKRGWGPIDATQRMGKFNKDVAAELKNAMIGWTWMDIDRDRAIETLGVGRKNRADYDKQLRSMTPGEFFVVGRAFGTFEPVKIKVGRVQSTHPEPGSAKQSAVPPPPSTIRALLAKLGDLPKEAAKKLETETELRARIAELEMRLASGGPAKAPFVAVPVRSLVAAPAAARTARVVPTAPTPPNPPEEIWTMEEEALYQKVVERLKREAPGLLKVLVMKPELDVEIKLATISLDGSSLRGRIATLIADGFFDEPREAIAVLHELRRRGGGAGDKNNYQRELGWLSHSGFLTREPSGFQAVEGMKVNIKRS